MKKKNETTGTKMGRPSKGIIGEGSHVSTNLKPELATKLRAMSAETGAPISELVRRAIEAYLKAK